MYIRYFKAGKSLYYGHIRCVYTVLANPTYKKIIVCLTESVWCVPINVLHLNAVLASRSSLTWKYSCFAAAASITFSKCNASAAFNLNYGRLPLLQAQAKARCWRPFKKVRNRVIKLWNRKQVLHERLPNDEESLRAVACEAALLHVRTLVTRTHAHTRAHTHTHTCAHTC